MIKKGDKKSILKRYNEPDLVYDASHAFHKYLNINKFDIFSLKSKHSFLVNFFNNIDKFETKNKAKEKKTNVYDKVSQLCN